MIASRRLLAGIDIPNPIDVITTTITAPAGWAWDKVADGIAKWVLGAVAFFVDGVVNFLLTSARPNVTAAWFSGAGSPYATVRGVAVALLLAFVFLGIIQGLIAGDTGAMIRRVTADLPTSIFGMVTTTVVVGKLLELTDALSSIVLSNSNGQAVHFLSGFGVAVTGSTQGFAAVTLGLVAVFAALMVWVELMVRSVLVYILVALSPLSFAAMVWPSARGVLRRTIELLIAVIVSKLVICISISVGVAALSGAGTAAGPGAASGDKAAASIGTLFVGTAILAMAAFAPFLILKLIPWAESAVAAQGVSRGPVRGAQSTMSNVYHAQSLSRLAGGGGRGAASSGTARKPVASKAGAGAVAGGPAGAAVAVGAKAGGAATKHVTTTVDQQTTTPTTPDRARKRPPPPPKNTKARPPKDKK